MVCVAFCAVNTAFADTFTNINTGEVLHGYIVEKNEASQAFVKTAEQGQTKINLAEWKIAYDRQGRENQVIVLSLDDAIALQLQTDAIKTSLAEAAKSGPLFILLEIDTPGGSIDYAMQMCSAITETGECPVYAYIKGGPNGGAISAGAAITLACKKVYMASNTSIGAATIVTFDEAGKIADFKDTYGENVGEKLGSYWRATLASLAEQNGRPGMLARAMVDKDIEVVEVEQDGKRQFIEPVNKRSGQKVLHTWNRKGSLLTLTANEAVQCGIADGLAETREQLLRQLNTADAQIVVNSGFQDATTEFERVKLKFDKIKNSMDLKYKKAQLPQNPAQALKILREAKSEYNTLARLSKQYPDMNLDPAKFEEEANTLEALMENIKRQVKQRRY